MYLTAHREIDHESGSFKPNLDCNYLFPIDIAIDLVPSGLPFGA